MADVDSHAPGAFAWVELATTDRPAAVAFYRNLFGWEVTDRPIGPDDIYSLLQMRGRDAAAAYSMRDDERRMGIPPHWNLYVSVENADATAARASELGATVLVAPFDVMDVGRMAVLQDPTGAVFSIWQSGTNKGVGVLGEPGALCWSELTTRDPKKAEAFYTALFNWRAKASTAAPMEYTEFTVAGRPGVGMMKMPDVLPPEVPSYWMPYFQVADCAAATEQGKRLGATVIVGPHQIPDGASFTIFKDPQGALFAIFAPKK